MEKKHTQGKWTACPGNGGEKFNIETDGIGNDLMPIATLKGLDRKANAAFIVTACNSYYDILKIKESNAALMSFLQSLVENAVHIGGTDFRIDEKFIDRANDFLNTQ